MDRLRDNRQRFLSRLRSLDTQTPSAHPPSAKEGSEVTSAVQTVMMEEWEGLRREVWGQETESGYLEHVLGVMDELREELIHEGVCVCVCICTPSSLCCNTVTWSVQL